MIINSNTWCFTKLNRILFDPESTSFGSSKLLIKSV